MPEREIYIPTDIMPGDKVRVPDGRVGIAVFYAPWNKFSHFKIRFIQEEWFSMDEVVKVAEE